MAYLEQVFIEGSTGAVLDSAVGTPNAHALTIQGNSSGVAVPVTGTFYQATQPVSGTVTAEIEGHAGATIDGPAGTASTQCVTIQGNASGTAVPVSGTFYPATQPVSGTVTAEIEGQAGATLDGAAGSPSTQCITVQGNASGTPLPTKDQANGPVSPGAAANNSELQGTVYDTTAPSPTNGQQVAAQCDARGNLYATIEGRKPTYRASFTVSPTTSLSSSTNPVVSIFGSASKTVKITRLRLSIEGSGGTTPFGTIYLLLVTSAFTGGTSAAITPALADQSDSSATATPKTWSVISTGGGSSAGYYDEFVLNIPSTTAESPTYLDEQFGNTGSKPITLRGVAQGLAICATLSATVTISGSIEWTEE